MKSPIIKYLPLIPEHNIVSPTLSEIIQKIYGTIVFGYCFDFNSSLIRKNPLNLVSAFNSVFIPTNIL